jgi:hypothetical protein
MKIAEGAAQQSVITYFGVIAWEGAAALAGRVVLLFADGAVRTWG